MALVMDSKVVTPSPIEGGMILAGSGGSTALPEGGVFLVQPEGGEALPEGESNSPEGSGAALSGALLCSLPSFKGSGVSLESSGALLCLLPLFEGSEVLCLKTNDVLSMSTKLLSF